MVVKVYLFLFLLGAVAACKKQLPIDKLVEEAKKNCEKAGRSSGTCQSFADKFKEETNKGASCSSSSISKVDVTYPSTISILSKTVAQDQTLLWSGPGMGDKADKKSGKVTLGKTSVGKSLYSLHWTKTEDSVKWYSSKKPCDSYRTTACRYPLETLYWALASKKFAEQASGQVEVYLIDDPPGKAYRPGSFFRDYEVPNLNPTKVTTLNIKLYGTSGKPGRKCRRITGIDDLCDDLKRIGIRTCKCLYAGTSKLAVTGNYSIQAETYWRPDGTCAIPPGSPGCMKLPSVITIIIPILTLLVKS